ncbi:MAG: CDP-glycerol glycerophosphotransferase family protein [Fibrobacter sp.]|nr:CDP-glycerol glycerophosphotransferase family protein [Fibrobacter sp.]
MVFSGYIIKLPYLAVWKLKKRLKKLHGLIVYIQLYQDYTTVENILPYLNKPYLICSDNKKVQNELKKKGIESVRWPIWGETVLMARHAFHKFPIKEIRKIGVNHGAYCFKDFISSKKFNEFDLYLFASEVENKNALSKGITIGQAGGHPRLDTLRSHETIKQASVIKENFTEKNRKLVLFSATWNGSGMSAIDKWVYRIEELASRYQIAATVHPKMDKEYSTILKSYKNIVFVNEEQLPAYMYASDILISDTSSIIGEFCALNKPIITFRVDSKSSRLTSEIKKLIEDISVQIDSFDELPEAIECYEKQPDLKKENREHYNKIMFDDVRVCQGKRAADIINKKLTQLAQNRN